MTTGHVSLFSWLEPGGRVDAAALLHALCHVHPDRRPGSPGNDEAVDLVAGLLSALGWRVECPRFPVVDWSGERGTLTLGDEAWPLEPSPYGLGYAGQAPLHPSQTRRRSRRGTTVRSCCSTVTSRLPP